MTGVTLRFRYLPSPKKDPKTKKIISEVYYPVVPVRISYGHKLSRSFYALVDSGADKNLFPASLGELVSINIKKGVKVTIEGIKQVHVEAYTHKLKLFLGNQSFDTTADFSYEHEVPLLGRKGFFNLFAQVTFKENKKVLEVVFK